MQPDHDFGPLQARLTKIAPSCRMAPLPDGQLLLSLGGIDVNTPSVINWTVTVGVRDGGYSSITRLRDGIDAMEGSEDNYVLMALENVAFEHLKRLYDGWTEPTLPCSELLTMEGWVEEQHHSVKAAIYHPGHVRESGIPREAMDVDVIFMGEFAGYMATLATGDWQKTLGTRFEVFRFDQSGAPHVDREYPPALTAVCENCWMVADAWHQGLTRVPEHHAPTPPMAA